MRHINHFCFSLVFIWLCFPLSLVGQKDYRLTLIKGDTGFIIDSVGVSSTYPNSVRGMAFRGDSVVLELPTYRPSDKLFIDTYAAGNYLGGVACWVDEGKATVHLSVNSGQTLIDSIQGSTLDDWYLSVMYEINNLNNPRSTAAYSALLDLVYTYANELVSAPYTRAILELWPNDYRKILRLREALSTQPSWLRRHPFYQPLIARIDWVTYNRTLRLKDFTLVDRGGKMVDKPLPRTPYTVLYFWSLGSPSSDVDHQIMVQERQDEVFPKGIPFIGICAPTEASIWNEYLRQRDIPWISYLEQADNGRLFSDRLGILVYPTYFLLNRRGKVTGIFDNYGDLRKTLEAVGIAEPKKQ